MEKLVNVIVKEGDSLSADSLMNIALCLNITLGPQFEERVFPEDDYSPK